MKNSAALALASLFLSASLAIAQFAPGPNPITGTVNTAQTLSAGTGTVNLGATLSVSGGTIAVTMSNGTAVTPVTLMNQGTVTQTGSGRAVRSTVDGSFLSIQNAAGATISAIGNDTIAIGKGDPGGSHDITVELINFGTISSGSGQQAVNFGNLTSGTNTIANSGTITASLSDAVRPGVNGTIQNGSSLGNATIMSTAANGSGSDGIDAQMNSGVQITNSYPSATTDSLIEAGRHGITGGDVFGGNYTMTITNYARGTIQGDNGAGLNFDGINGNEIVTVINHGIITGNGSALAPGDTGKDGDGVDVDGLVNLTNDGTIRSINSINNTSEGVTVGGGTITNNAPGVIQEFGFESWRR